MEPPVAVDRLPLVPDGLVEDRPVPLALPALPAPVLEVELAVVPVLLPEAELLLEPGVLRVPEALPLDAPEPDEDVVDAAMNSLMESRPSRSESSALNWVTQGIELLPDNDPAGVSAALVERSRELPTPVAEEFEPEDGVLVVPELELGFIDEPLPVVEEPVVEEPVDEPVLEEPLDVGLYGLVEASGLELEFRSELELEPGLLELELLEPEEEPEPPKPLCAITGIVSKARLLLTTIPANLLWSFIFLGV